MDERVHLPIASTHVQPYGDLAEVSAPGPIRRLIGPTLLRHFVDEFLSHLRSSAAVYERDGRYALGIFASGWCRHMDQSSRALCATDDNREALESPHWHCHRSCLEISEAAMRAGEPVDRPCLGGLRIFAAPIRSGDEVLGAINFGYADPPADPEELQQLAERYGVSAAELERLAEEHEHIPESVVGTAKTRLVSVAQLVGEMVGRKRAEEERSKLEAKMGRRQKLESLGVLAGGIAHDFNNLLVAVLGNAELLRDSLEDPSQRERADEILRAALSARRLSRQMLSYAGRTHVAGEPVALPVVLADTLELLRAAIGASVTVEVEVSNDLPQVHGDAAGLQQVIMNLVINAAESLGGKAGRVWLRSGTTTVEEHWSPEGSVHGALRPGPHVFVEVEDQGAGMEAHLMERIFEPFYSTKDAARGLGMAAVLGIVRSHRGAIQVRSEPGRGTCVRVVLPVAPEAKRRAPAISPERSEVPQRATLLLVDDEDLVRATCRDLLEREGYRVWCASNGKEALDKFAARAQELTAAIIDRTMPELTGDQVARELHALRPDLPIVLMSGYGEDPEPTDRSSLVFLSKPFRATELTSSLRRALATADLSSQAP